MKLLGYISSGSIILPFIAGLLRYRSNLAYQWYFFAFIAFSLLIECVMVYAAAQDIRNIGFIHLFIIVEFIFLSWLYSYQFIRSRALLYIICIVSGFVLAMELVLYFNDKLNDLDGLLTGIIYIYFIALAGYHLLYIFDKPQLTPLTKQPDFWISTGILVYFVITIALYVANEYFWHGNNNKIMTNTFAIINTFGNITGNIIFAYSYLCNKQRATYS